MRYQIIAQPKDAISAFVSIRQNQANPWGRVDGYSTLGLLRNGYLIAGVVYNNFEAKNVCAHIAAIEGRHWLNRQFLFAMFDYPFTQLGKNRITGLVARSNHTCRRFVRSLGFKLEGKMPGYYENDDMLIFGMLRKDCRWLQLAPHEQQLKEAA